MSLRSVRLLALAFGAFVYASSAAAQKAEVSPQLQAELDAGGGGLLDVYAVLHTQVDGRALAREASSRGASREQRASYVIERLRHRHTAAQADFVAALRSEPSVTDVRGRWLVNLVGFRASRETVRDIAGHPDVAGLFLDLPWEAEGAVASATAAAIPNGTEPGLRAIRAPQMWRRGYTGFGGVAFVADTGVDPFHPALNHKYAAGVDNTTWYDFSGTFVDPYDCDDHGTHVAGTVLGLDRNTADTIGVAFNAHWVGGAILCGIGTADNIGAFEWALDPDGDLSTTADRPFVINNSWRDPSIGSIECSSANPYPAVLDNLAAAGVAVVFSAGNEGPDPRTITPPHNYNAGLVNAFTVGALNGNSGALTIAGFSSRGPALCNRDSVELDIKPEVSAPGVSVRSALPGNGYGLKSGTSMASPHVAGALLLLHEAFPQLTGEELQLALYYTARDLGDPGEDNVYGRGIIDVDAAFAYLVDAGHVAQAPSFPDLAPQITGIEAAEQQCGGRLSLTLTLRNAGDVAFDSLAYALYVDDEIASRGSFAAGLLPGEVGDFQIDADGTWSGELQPRVVLTEADGQSLDTRLDLVATFRVDASGFAEPSLAIATDTAALCAGSPLILALDGDREGPLQAHFSTRPDRPLTDVGPTGAFVVRALSEPAVTLYGTAEYVRTGGPSLPDTADMVVVDPRSTTMSFRALEDVRVRSVSVLDPEGDRLIFNVENEDGLSVARVSESLQPGVNRLTVDAVLEAGEVYTVTFRRVGELAYDPFTRVDRLRIASVLDVLDVDAEGDRQVERGSFFLFDWEVGLFDGCAPVPVDVRVDTARAAAQLAVEAQPDTIALGASVVFAETTLAAADGYSWYFDGEGLVAQVGSSVSVSPDRVGTFEAYTAAADPEGCLSGGAAEVVVTQPVSPSIIPALAPLRVWPNPTAESFAIDLPAASAGSSVSVRLLDLRGREVRVWSGARDRYDASGLAPGTYVLRVESSEGLLGTERLSLMPAR